MGERVDRFFEADLDRDFRPRSRRTYDVVLAADVLEHVRDPERLLGQMREPARARGAADRLGPELRALVPTGARRARPLRLRPARHPRPRPRALLHPPRHQTAPRACRLHDHPAGGDRTAAGRSVERRRRVPTVAARHRSLAVIARPTLFGYQFVFQCESTRRPSIARARRVTEVAAALPAAARGRTTRLDDGGGRLRPPDGCGRSRSACRC